MSKTGIDVGDWDVLRAHAFDTTREFLLAHPEYKPTPPQRKRLASYLRRRTTHEPVAMIIGRKAFFDIELEVTRGVLVPRPETELLVEIAIDVARSGDVQIIDVGTGSGAIALTLAKHLPQAEIIATDVSTKALTLAKKNALRLGLSRRVRFVKTNLLPKLGGKTPPLQHIIVANLPYLPTAVWQSAAPDVKNFEPRTALDGGRDGLDAYRSLFQVMADRGVMNHAPTTLIIEIDPSQKKLLPAAVRRFFPKAHLSFKKDLAGRWRVVVITPRPRSGA